MPTVKGSLKEKGEKLLPDFQQCCWTYTLNICIHHRNQEKIDTCTKMAPLSKANRFTSRSVLSPHELHVNCTSKLLLGRFKSMVAPFTCEILLVYWHQRAQDKANIWKEDNAWCLPTSCFWNIITEETDWHFPYSRYATTNELNRHSITKIIKPSHPQLQFRPQYKGFWSTRTGIATAIAAASTGIYPQFSNAAAAAI